MRIGPRPGPLSCCVPAGPQTFPSPSLGPPLLSESWSPPPFWGMPPPLLLLAVARLGPGGGELCALAGAAGELAGWVPGVLEVGDEPPQAVTNATSAADMIMRTRFVVMNLLHRVVRSAPGLSRTLPPSGSPAAGKSPLVGTNGSADGLVTAHPPGERRPGQQRPA